jgi:hypothetical protein
MRGTREEAGYRRTYWLQRRLPRLSSAQSDMLVMAGLPLIDGVFVSAAASGVLADPVAALSLGLVLFSGPGTIAASFALAGSTRDRVLAVLPVYALLAPAVLLTLLSLAGFQALVLPHFEYVSAAVLLGLAAKLLGLGVPASWPARGPLGWAAGLGRLALDPRAVLGAAVAASAARAAFVRAPLTTELPAGAELTGALVALAAGLLLTLGGVLLTDSLGVLLDPVAARRGGGVALLLVAGLIVGAPVPGWAPLVAFAAGLLSGVVAGARGGGTPSPA